MIQIAQLCEPTKAHHIVNVTNLLTTEHYAIWCNLMKAIRLLSAACLIQVFS